jgi:hypothetical protein
MENLELADGHIGAHAIDERCPLVNPQLKRPEMDGFVGERVFRCRFHWHRGTERYV